MTYDAFYSYRGMERRLRRPILVLVTATLASLITAIAIVTIFCQWDNANSPKWNESKLVCTGSQFTESGTVFFIRNSMSQDYRPKQDVLVLMRQLPGGLLADSAVKLTFPIFVPSKQTCGIQVEGPPGSFVLFDVSARLKVTLKAR